MPGSTGGENSLDCTRQTAFQTLAINIPGIVYRIHLREQNRMEFFNHMVEKMTGYKADELKRGEVCSIDSIIVSADRARVLKVVKDAARENRPFEIEYRITHKRGDSRYFLERGQPIYGTDGQPEFLDGVILDITDRKCSEVALRESEERFRQITENIREVFWIISPDWMEVLYVSPTYESVWGRPCDSLYEQPRSWLDAVVDEDRMRILEEVNRKSAGDLSDPRFSEYRISRPDSSIRWIFARAFPVRNEQGQVYRIVGIAEDITERKRAEEALLFKEHIIEHSSSAIATCDLEGNMTYGNPSFLKKWGFDSPEEFLGEPFWKFWLVEDRLEEIMQALKGDGSWFGEIRAKRKDGVAFDAQVSAAVVLDGKGNPLALTSTSTDITERKRAEEALRQARDELEQRVRERTAELERSNRELQDFAFIASHDLQEPLRKIRAFGDMIVRKSAKVLSEESLDYLNRMKKAVTRMHELLTSLLDYSRVTTKASPFEPIDLNESVGESLSNLEVLIREKNGHIEVGRLPTLEAEPVQIVQLFQNLIANALKFHRSGEAPLIKIYESPVGSGRNTDAYRVLIEDNGIGFDEKDLEQIFVPFHRLHGKSKYEGVGMGLAICKKIVERHDGEITAKSEPGKGSTFIVTLPKKQKPRD
jgi:PAS domain S-box-containing protein